jgi:hypothetical protein
MSLGLLVHALSSIFDVSKTPPESGHGIVFILFKFSIFDVSKHRQRVVTG